MTFQELVDKIGIDNVFTNTSADLATQNCILEWFFDYDLCDDNETKWLRYFRRRVNEIYPRYKELVRIMTVKENMDPFITVFMEKIHKTSDMKDTSFIESVDQSTGKLNVITVGTNNTKVSSDGTKIEHGFDQYKETHNRGNDGITSEDSYENYHEHVSGVSGGSNSARTYGDAEDNYSQTNQVVSTAENRSVGIAYPEANMGSTIPSGVASDIGSTGSEYASNEQRSFSKSTTPQVKTLTNIDSTVDTDYGDIDSNDKTISGKHKVTEKGIDTYSKEGISYDQHSGSKTEFDNGEKTQTTNDAGSSSAGKTHWTNSGSEGKLEVAEQGRTESPADILPRAINAIIGTDEIKFLIDGLIICFDVYARI